MKLGKFYINTQFTALKQLPKMYRASIRVDSRIIPAYALYTNLGTAILAVPTGVYVENFILRCGIDGNKNHLAPQIVVPIGDGRGFFFVAVNQVTNNQYELSVRANNPNDSSISIPRCDVEVLAKLAIAPF